MWTQENSEGFSDAELEMINRVEGRIIKEHPDIDPGYICDATCSEWRDGICEECLEVFVRRVLGI